MEFAVRWTHKDSDTNGIATGLSIPEALENGRSWYGIHFTFGEKEYGVLTGSKKFVPVPELENPNAYESQELNNIILERYQNALKEGEE